ncbi:MAG TPA: nuclear transport factor 2 family protein [Gemmatimonadaceae bacterium]|nr:nuclear transport factor 2 family protein [Gemmatimonadaceae bacterium]
MKTCLAVVLCALALGPRDLAAQPGHTAQDRSAVREALQHYNALVERMAHDSIAALYTADGRLDAPGRAPIVGPAAIRDFLHQFAEFRVIFQRMTSDSIEIRGDTALQSGRWWQRVRVPRGDMVAVGGAFTAEWRRDHGGWRLFQMNAMPSRVPPDSTRD